MKMTWVSELTRKTNNDLVVRIYCFSTRRETTRKQNSMWRFVRQKNKAGIYAGRIDKKCRA